MKRNLLKIFLMMALAVVLCTASAWAYTINDSPNDSIGYPTYESYGINVSNFTPGSNTGSILIDLFTNFPQAGETVNSGPYSWTTRPADLFITETYYGNQIQWAIPLVAHDGFAAGGFYQVASFNTSDDMDPSHNTGYYLYNYDVPVSITSGTQCPNQSGSVSWNSLPGLPDFRVHIDTGVYEDDPNGAMSFLWGTATCGNDVVSSVPIPPSALLLGSGLLGLVGMRKFRKC